MMFEVARKVTADPATFDLADQQACITEYRMIHKGIFSDDFETGWDS